MDWIAGIQRAIDYIEAHLNDELDYSAIAREGFSSPFHFQRVFSILCGYTLGEWNWEETWSTISYLNSNSQPASSYKRYTYSLGDGKKWYFSAGNLYDTAPGTRDANGSDAVVINTWYSSRTKTTTYYYERWGAWSDWSTTEPQNADTRDIESRTLLHDWDDGDVFTSATCSAPGVLQYTCQRDGCGATKTEPININPDNHVNTQNVNAVASTCKVKGYSAGVYCNDCQKYVSGHEEQPLDANNHVNTKNVNAVASTCKVKGYSAGVYCNDCQKYVSGHEEQPLDANNHVNTKNVNAVPSTCTVNGYSAGVYCDDCQKYVSGHQKQGLANHTITIINKKDATYDTEGYTGDEYCTVCKQTIKTGSAIPKLQRPQEPTQSGGRCKWCGKTHPGFFGWFVAIFHKILVFLFGAKY